MNPTAEDILGLVRREAELHAAVGENLKGLVAFGKRAGVAGADLSRASGLSKAAIAEIKSTPDGGRRLEPAEIAELLATVRNVVIVAAGRVAYREYRAYGVYICQAGRFFRPEMDRFGFYADQEVKPQFPKYLDVEDYVRFTPAAAEALRAEGRDLLANAVERVIADGARNATDPHKMYALSTSDDRENTLVLDAPIRHMTTGPGTGFVQKQTYVSERALLRQPKTTRELLEFDQS